jgi:hypothetical protein
MTQAMSFLEAKPKTVFDIIMITLHQAWPSYFLSMPCICKGMCVVESMGGNLKKTSPMKAIGTN